ncbi:hypothetical protein CRG98_047209, partial [Punica granatum]
MCRHRAQFVGRRFDLIGVDLTSVTMPDMFHTISLHGGPIITQAHDLLSKHEAVHVRSTVSPVHFLHETSRFMLVDSPEECGVEGAAVKYLAAQEVVYHEASESLPIAAVGEWG